MKRAIGILGTIGLVVAAAPSFSGTVATTFSNGDTLTAAGLTEIRSAVNDNDANVATNASDIATNAADITTNASDIATNAATISTNSTGIASNVTELSNQDARITALEGAGGGGGSSAFGDGSSGALTVSSSQDWTDAGGDAPADDGLLFTDITINSGQTLTVPSGTILRCTGTFTNDGTLAVDFGQKGSSITNGPDLLSRDRGENLTGNGNWNVVGEPYDEVVLRQLLDPNAVTGQAGGIGNIWNGGGSGGGSVVILCETGIDNSGGTIDAAGGNAETVGDGTQCTFTGSGCDLTAATDIDDDQRGGGGGGSGGLVVMATSGTIAAGTVELGGGNGANGGNSTTSTSGGGGGGGGVLHLIAPAASSVSTGSVDVSGGTRGSSTNGSGGLCTNEADASCGTTRNGGVGGSFGGRGGYGGSGSSGSNSGCFYALLLAGDLSYPLSGGEPADYNNDCNVGRNGSSGVILTTDIADPSALF